MDLPDDEIVVLPPKKKPRVTIKSIDGIMPTDIGCLSSAVPKYEEMMDMTCLFKVR
jgi:hypothetical protein